MAGEVAKIVVTIGGDTYQLEQAVGKSKKEINGLSKEAKEVGAMIVAYFAVDKIMSFASSIISVRSEFEKYSAVLANSLGSQKQSADAMAMLQKFAQQTPFQLTELTDAYVKLVNRGLRPSQSELTKVGDFASATGKSFDQLNEAILDANNPERWKEFGVQTKTMGDRVQLTFRGVTVEVERSAAGAMKAVEAFGQLDGISGTMSAQMETLGGKVSNLKDAWDQMLNHIGESSMWKKAVELAGNTVNKINEIMMGGKSTIAKEERASKEADKYIESLKEEIKQTGDLAKAQKILSEEEQDLANQYYKLIDIKKVLSDPKLSPKEKKEQIGFEDFNKYFGDGLETWSEDFRTVQKEWQATIELMKNNSLVDAILTPKKDDPKTNPLGYIEGLKAKIKELTESIEKSPNDMTLLTSLQTELNKTKKELDIVLSKLADLSIQEIGKPIFEGSKFKGQGGLEMGAMFDGNQFKGSGGLDMGAMFDGKQFENGLKQFETKYIAFRDAVLDISQDLNASLADVFSSIAEGIGQALAGGNTTDILKNFIATLGGLMASFGKMLIAWGVAQIALKESILNPYAALAAGAALVIIGSAMSQKSSEITGSQSANYGSKYGGSGRATNEQLTQHVEFDIRGDIIRAIVRNDTKIVQRIR